MFFFYIKQCYNLAFLCIVGMGNCRTTLETRLPRVATTRRYDDFGFDSKKLSFRRIVSTVFLTSY